MAPLSLTSRLTLFFTMVAAAVVLGLGLLFLLALLLTLQWVLVTTQFVSLTSPLLTQSLVATVQTHLLHLQQFLQQLGQTSPASKLFKFLVAQLLLCHLQTLFQLSQFQTTLVAH